MEMFKDTKLEEVLKELRGQPVYLTLVLISAVFINLALVFNDKYLFHGFITLVYAFLGYFLRIFYKDLLKHVIKVKYVSLLIIVYNIIQISLTIVWGLVLLNKF